jgi:UDP-N-acetylmuramoylalanine--D-glutamate ligase
MNYKGKKVAVFGLGVSGVSAVRLLVREGAHVWAVNEGRPAQWKNFSPISALINTDRLVAQEDVSSKHGIFTQVDEIILSPGIPRTHPLLVSAIAKGIPVISEIELGYRFCNCPVIAVTGTNGKTTTVHLISDLLKQAKIPHFLGGNVGTPFCDFSFSNEKRDFAILELSSFQLESMVTFTPRIALLLNLAMTHGERYDRIEDYARSKFHIADRMNEQGILIAGEHALVEGWLPSLKMRTKIVRFEGVKTELEQSFDLSKLKLLGRHNLVNLYFTWQVMKELRLPKEAMQKTISTFPGVPFRLQPLETGMKWKAVNDAKSTNFEATLTALRAFPEGENLHLILGGKRRGTSDSIVPYLGEFKRRCRKIYLIGDMAGSLAAELDGTIEIEVSGTLEKVRASVERSGFDGIVLFSPAFPSFDQFANYVERGKAFTRIFGRN